MARKKQPTKAATTPAKVSTAKPDKPTATEAETPAAPETKPDPSPVPNAPKEETPEGLRVYSVCCEGTLLGTKLVKAHNADEAFIVYKGDSGMRNHPKPIISLCPDLDPDNLPEGVKLSN